MRFDALWRKADTLRTSALVPAALTMLTLTGCAAVGPVYVSPDTPAPAAWNSEVQGCSTAGQMDPHTLASWWTMLDERDPGAQRRATLYAAGGRKRGGIQRGGILNTLLPHPPRNSPKRPGSESARDKQRRVWMLQGRRPVAIPVATGSADGIITEVTGGDVEPGMALVVDAISAGR